MSRPALCPSPSASTNHTGDSVQTCGWSPASTGVIQKNKPKHLCMPAYHSAIHSYFEPFAQEDLTEHARFTVYSKMWVTKERSIRVRFRGREDNFPLSLLSSSSWPRNYIYVRQVNRRRQPNLITYVRMGLKNTQDGWGFYAILGWGEEEAKIGTLKGRKDTHVEIEKHMFAGSS